MERSLIREERTTQVLQKTTLLGKKLTVYGTVENPLFLAKDVAEWIDYTKRSDGSYNVSMMLQSVDQDEKSTAKIVGGRTNNECWLLTEDGLYEVLMLSRKPIAKQFKKGVKDILKEIRKTGNYSSYPKLPQNYIEALETLVETEKAKQLLELKNQKLVEDNQHKKDVIEGLIYEIPLADMRQRINQIVRGDKGNTFRGSWHLLYSEFERKYHLNIGTRMNNMNYSGNKMDYIETELKMIPEMYDMACKLFESSYSKLMKEWGRAVRRASRYN
jgi:prophage antirepressor-like protein